MVVRILSYGAGTSKEKIAQIKRDNPKAVDYVKKYGGGKKAKEQARIDVEENRIVRKVEANLVEQNVEQKEANEIAKLYSKSKFTEVNERIDRLNSARMSDDGLNMSVARASDLRYSDPERFADAPMSYPRGSGVATSNQDKVKVMNNLFPERVSVFREQSEARGISLEKNYAPSVVDRDFYTFEGQGQALTRGAVGLAQAEKEIANTVVQTVTLGKYKPFKENTDFTAETRITGEKVGYLLEQGANNPLTTVSIVASVIAGGAGLATFASGAGLRASVGTATGTIGGKGITGTLIRGTNTLIASTGARGGTELLIDSVRLTNEEAGIMRTDEFKEAQSVAFERQKDEAGVWGKIGQEVSLFSPTTKSYDSYLREELINRGFTGQELETGVRAGKKSRISKGYGELAGLITLSAGSEVTGRFTQKSFTNYVTGKGYNLAGSFGKSATITGLSVAPAGFFEGYGQQLIQQSARAEKSDYGEALKYGIVGSATAFTLGGLIGGSANSGRKALERSSKLVAYTTDPYEKIGDYTADAFQKTIGRGSRTIYLNANTITLTPSFTNTPTNTNTPSKSKGKIGFNPSFIPSYTNAPTNTNVFVNTPAFEISSSFTSINTPIENTPVSINTPTSINTPVSINTNVNTNVFTNTPVNTNVNTNVFTNTPVNTNVFTTNLKLPPLPMVLGGGGGSGSGGRSSRGRKVKQTKKPSSLIGLTFGYGEVNTGQTFSGLGVRR